MDGIERLRAQRTERAPGPTRQPQQGRRVRRGEGVAVDERRVDVSCRLDGRVRVVRVRRLMNDQVVGLGEAAGYLRAKPRDHELDPRARVEGRLAADRHAPAVLRDVEPLEEPHLPRHRIEVRALHPLGDDHRRLRQLAFRNEDAGAGVGVADAVEVVVVPRLTVRLERALAARRRVAAGAEQTELHTEFDVDRVAVVEGVERRALVDGRRVVLGVKVPVTHRVGPDHHRQPVVLVGVETRVGGVPDR